MAEKIKEKDFTPALCYDRVLTLGRKLHMVVVDETADIPDKARWLVMSRAICYLFQRHFVVTYQDASHHVASVERRNNEQT